MQQPLPRRGLTKKPPSQLKRALLPISNAFKQQTWDRVISAIRSIIIQEALPIGMEDLYQDVDKLCDFNMAADLYEQIKIDWESSISSTLQYLEFQTEDPVVFLRLVRDYWHHFSQQILAISSITMLLNNRYVNQTHDLSTLRQVALQQFGRHFSTASVQKTASGLFMMIERERSGEAVETSLFDHPLQMFIALGIYEERFERPFLEHTYEFYAKERVKYMEQQDVSYYLKCVEMRLHDANQKCLTYLDADTRRTLLTTTGNFFLEPYFHKILNESFVMMMNDKRIDDLRRMYLLFDRANALNSLTEPLERYIKRSGQAIMDEEEGDMIKKLLELTSKIDSIWEESFSKSGVLSITIKVAYEHILNLREKQPVLLIAKFLDGKLRVGNKDTSEEELEAELDKIVVLLRFTQGQDDFEALYKTHLAKRLLLGKSTSIDAEKSMIIKLKTVCGSLFTNKLERMYKDIELSKDINESFKQSFEVTRLPPGMKMSVQVLTTGYWPTYTEVDVQLPNELRVCQDSFKDFYRSNHSGRKLVWKNSLSQFVLNAEFPNGRKELTVSLLQTLVLLLFNEAPSLSFKDIKRTIDIEDEALRGTLDSLACGKHRILKKTTKGRDVQDEDVFTFNDQFASKSYNIKINTIQMKETLKEDARTREKVHLDRRYEVDAAIIRIMKMRKVLSHDQLMIQLTKQLKFPTERVLVKKRIAWLIDQEYLERDKGDWQTYKYLA